MEARKIKLAKRARGLGEVPDPTPVAIPAGINQPTAMESVLQAMLQRELAKFAVSNEQGTFEEEDDFEEEDTEVGIFSDYQLHQMERDLLADEPDFSLDDHTAEEAPAMDKSAPVDPSTEGLSNEAPTAQIQPEKQ